MTRLSLLLLALVAISAARAASPTREQTEFFESRIRPVLADNCYSCHSQRAEKVKGGFLLDTREALLKGGDSGPAIVPGNPKASLLVQAIAYTNSDLQMPPKGKKLSERQIADITTWVQMGAPDPRVATAAQKAWVDPAKKHWAWAPVSNPTVPEAKTQGWAWTPVDHFILARLEARGFSPNPPADKRTLIRRATFDLIGLPPTVEEVNAFLEDESPAAFERVVDRLLASPHYGERWGRHWLDIARYSDTKGQIRRNREDPNYVHAWTYRDYVIRSFNEDKPYNVFISEQVAADKMPGSAQNRTNLTALAFLTVGDRFMGMQHDVINDRIDVVTRGFLGLTVSCARCHDHKFDPIPTSDYYSLHGIFASTRDPAIEPIISTVFNTEGYRDYYKKRTALEEESKAIDTRFREARRKKDRDAIRQIQRDLKQNSGAIARLDMTHDAAPIRAMAVEDAPRGKDSPVFLRGEAENRGPVVPRRFLEVLSGPDRPNYTNGSGRVQLAQAITSRNNPLTARVLVNRVWQHHFGQGFVPTPDDFGTMSEPPSHPELLDHLATRFMNEGWSIKKLHRTIMLSAVYQQSSRTNPQYAEVDPGNRLLWRANIRRLEFEPLRDSLLAIGGSLDRTMYGRPVDLTREPYVTRRTVYGFIDRTSPADVLLNFDFSPPDTLSGKRYETTVPQQALFFMNSPLVVEQARHLVKSEAFRQLTSDDERVTYLYNRIYQRPPSKIEVQLGRDFVVEPPSQDRVILASNSSGKPGKPNFRPGKRSPGRDPLSAWEEYAHALFQANEFSFVN